MAIFEYAAMTKAGKATKGVIDADTPAAARRKLREQGLFPTDVQESAAHGKTASSMDTTQGKENGKGLRQGRNVGRVPVRDVALMTRQFAVLLQAGMPLVEALTAVLEQTTNPRLKRAIYDIRDHVKGGATLSASLARHPRVFSQLYCNMVGAGESSGALEQVLLRLADIEEQHARMRSRLMSMMAYPIFMAVFAVGIVSFMMLVIIPRLTVLFTKQKTELPQITKIMVGASHVIGYYWWVILLVVLGVFLLWRLWVSTTSGRLRWDHWRLRCPLYGNLHLKLITGRFARTLGTMLQSGLSMMKALDVVKSVVDNKVIENAMDDIKAGVRRGKDLAQPLRETGLFPPMLLHMVELGQRSGEMENMLIKVAETYDEDVRLAVDAIVGLLEPLIIIVMGIFVGFLVMSIMLPILNMAKRL